MPIAAQTADLPPTPLEVFAARPGATLTWSKALGQLESPASRATLTAVAFEDASSTPRVMRVLRIDLAHRQPNPNCEAG